MEVSVGLSAACLPPLGPIIRRLPSPHNIYTSIRHGLAAFSFSSGETKLSERLSSVEHIPSVGTPEVGKKSKPRESERELSDGPWAIEMKRYARSTEIV